jgi:hypothetical protein
MDGKTRRGVRKEIVRVKVIWPRKNKEEINGFDEDGQALLNISSSINDSKTQTV